MKTLKVLFVTALMILGTVGFAQSPNQLPNNEQPVNHEILIALQDALQIHGLFVEMHRQLKPDFLNPDQYAYWATVKYRGNLYYIKGSHQAWLHFFETKPMIGKER